ncbi:MAG: trypsin-like peptidase domain-containing protein [Planctomycetota bacterium]
MLRFRHFLVAAVTLWIAPTPWISLANPAPANADEFDFPSLQQELLETIERVRPAVVTISNRGSMCSGVIVSPDGHVLSAGHAITPGDRYWVALPDGRRFRGIGKGSNPRADCALVQITDPGGDLPHVPMGESSTLVRNQACLSLSFPGGQKAGGEPIARFGRIVRTGRYRGMLQSTALMEPGDSGGALFDLNGSVIGIHSRIGESMERNYEVPIDVYRQFWNELNREQVFTRSGPPTPRLGIRCRDADDGVGLVVLEVVNESLASKYSVERDDTIVQIDDVKLRSVSDLRRVLIDARDSDARTINVRLRRADEDVDLEMDFDVEREAAPEVPLPKTDRPKIPPRRGFNELADLVDQFADLEADLDDACVEITSTFGQDESHPITGTKIRNTRWIVSKSSDVGSDPIDSDTGTALAIIKRDRTNDLVLLEAPEVHREGVDLSQSQADLAVGTFLLTPDENGSGRMSIVSSPSFESRKQQSRGFLGVVPATYKQNQGAFLNEVTEDGAAKRAGLLAGDVITKMNDTLIQTQRDMRQFLARVDPKATITAVVRRDDDEMVKSILLDAFPSFSNHAADQMSKSGRRDGFSKVLPHDANLKPADCGGPIFDTGGKFVGLNIARNSRVRSYALPASVVQEFVPMNQ